MTYQPGSDTYILKKFVLVMLLLLSSVASAQKITHKKDTIQVNNKSFMLFQKTGRFDQYIYKSLNNNELLEIHDSKIEIKNKPLCIVTFSNDKRKAAIIQSAKGADFFTKLIYDSKLVFNNAVDTNAESKFIAAHPLPPGYTDIDEQVEY